MEAKNVITSISKVIQATCKDCADCVAPAEAVNISHIRPLLRRIKGVEDERDKLRVALKCLYLEALKVDECAFLGTLDLWREDTLKKSRATLARVKEKVQP